MTNSLSLEPVIIPPGDRPVYSAFGDQITVHISGEESGGKFTMFTDVTMPGGGPPLHYHENEDEWFYVLEGSVEFHKDGRWTEVPVGGAAFMPKGCVHTFRNPGNTPLKMLVHAAPSGFEIFFARCAEEFKNPKGPDMNRILEISAEHGIHFVNP